MAQRDTSSAVRLNLGGDTMTLSVRDQDYGNVVEELDVKYEGDDMLVGFNPDYLMNGSTRSTPTRSHCRCAIR